MCDFCVQHGEGKKWYLQAKNYGEDLLSDASRRRFITDFFDDPEHLTESGRQLERLSKAPAFVRRVVRGVITRRMKKWHYGQVVPLEEIEEIFEFVNSIVRVPCVCRYASLGEEARYCYGVSMGPGGGRFVELLRGLDASFLTGPDSSGIETLTKEQTLEAFGEHEKEGLCHTVWTFKAPFIGGICNCDRADCMAMKATVTHDVPVMFRGEYVAEVDPEACTGCRSCMQACQFGALGYSAAQQKAVVDPTACYGCGTCRAACNQNAIALRPRAEVPLAANRW